MNKKRQGGFTLVELIVVIAILGILAGVGTVAYTGYVEKANKAVDEQLVADIEYAIKLAGAGNVFAEGEGGYVLLSTDGIENADDIAEGSNLDTALKAAFGDDYKNTLKLTYANWGSSNNGLYNNLNPEVAYLVKNSSYLSGNRSDSLLSDVEKMTGMAMNLVTVLASDSGLTAGMTLSQMFTNGETCAIDSTANKYGIDKGSYGTWEEWAAASEANKTAYSNLLVLTAADEAETYVSSDYDDESISGASQLILEFSSFYAYAATNEGFSNTLDTYLNQLTDGTTVTNAASGATWFNNLKSAANAAGYSSYSDNNDAVWADQAAFLGILSGIGNPSEEQASKVASDISNGNLFTNGIVNDMYNQYLDGVEALAGLYVEGGDYSESFFDLDSGNVAVMYVMNAATPTVTNSLPN